MDMNKDIVAMKATQDVWLRMTSVVVFWLMFWNAEMYMMRPNKMIIDTNVGITEFDSNGDHFIVWIAMPSNVTLRAKYKYVLMT